MKKISNFLVIKNRIPWRTTVCYIDRRTPHPAGYGFFEAAEIPVRFRFEGRNDTKDFIFVICSFNKKYNKKVEEILARLDTFLLLTERNEYSNFKEYANKLLEGALEWDSDTDLEKNLVL